jgi:OHCU decarboxylase
MMDRHPHLHSLNEMSASEATAEFLKCCGSRKWAGRMVESRPFESLDELTTHATDVWWNLEHDDWLEAFRSHPRIGERKAANQLSLQSRAWSRQEQAGVDKAAKQMLDELADLNRQYEAKFGYIFIVCATGKSSEEMLAILKSRIRNNAETELSIAAGEQAKITEIRLRKLIA